MSVRAIPPTLDAAFIVLGSSVSLASALSSFGQKLSSPLYMNTYTGFV